MALFNKIIFMGRFLTGDSFLLTEKTDWSCVNSKDFLCYGQNPAGFLVVQLSL